MGTLPTGYVSRDVAQGGENAYAGAVSGLEAGTALNVDEGYPDIDIHEFYNLGVIPSLTSAQSFVLYEGMREWTLDHLDLTSNVWVTSVNVVSVKLYRCPVGTKIASLTSGEQIGATVTIDCSDVAGDDVKIGFEFLNLSEQARRFTRGERFVMTLTADGAGDSIGLVTGIVLGRQRRA